MNGSGTPVSGASPRTTKMLRMPWHRISEVSPLASSFAYRRRGPARRAQSGVRDHPVQEHDAEDPQHAELLADHREDEVGLGLRAGRRSSAPTCRGRRRAGRQSRARSAPGRPGSRPSTSRTTDAGTRSAAPAGRAGRVTISSTATIASSASSPRWRAGIPAAIISAVSEKAITSVVPRSGSTTHQQARRTGGERDRRHRLAEATQPLRMVGEVAGDVEDERELDELRGLELDRAERRTSAGRR